MTARTFLSRLSGVRRTGAGRWIARCPAHDDRRASLCVSQVDDGRVLVHCFAGCDTSDVLAAVDLSFSDLYPPRPVERGLRLRRPFPAADVLQAMAFEAMVVYVSAQTLDRGNKLNASELARLRLAVARLQHAVVVACDG